MSVLLLPTKLYIPRMRAGGVSRPRLTQKLLDAVERPGCFVLLSGPAGFGKTTLLAEFAAELEQPPAWLSLEEADSDPVRFWTYLISACQSILPEIGRDAQALLQSPQPLPDETLTTLLIHDLVRLQDDIVLVLDDYHNIQNSRIHAGLSFLLEHLPERFHLIISTRSDPPWPLALYRARDRLVEIRAADLRFTSEETARFLKDVMRLNVSAQDASDLEARTEGWIASLQLAAVSMRGREDISGFIRAFTGSHVYVAEYLIEEVLERQTEEVKNFLMQTSILERLSSGLCEAVSGCPDGQAILKDLYQANLFLVALDDEAQWYRYHHLFADLLWARSKQMIPADEIALLHGRAARWFEQNGHPGEAIRHALARQDFETAARLVNDHAFQAMIRGELATLLHWTEALPDEILRRYPMILIKKAWALTLAGGIRQVEPLLQQAEAQIGADESDLSTRELSGNAAAMRAFFAMMKGEYPLALELARRAERLLPDENVHISWLVPYTLGAIYRSQGYYEKAVAEFTRQALMSETSDNLILWATGVTEIAIVRRLQGRLSDAQETCRLALQRMEERGASSFGSLAKLEVPLIEVYLEKNELAAAHGRVTDVLMRMQSWPMPTDRIFALLAQIHVQQAQGDVVGALETLQTAKDVKNKQPVLMNLARSVDLAEVRLLLETGDLQAAARLLDELQPGSSPVVATREQELLMLARLRIVQGKPDEAEAILSRLAGEAETREQNRALIEIVALQAIALAAQGNRTESLQVLTQALRLGEPEGFVRLFVDEGESMRRLLSALSRQLAPATDEPPGSLKLYIAQLLEAFSTGPVGSETHPLPNQDEELVEPLTRRELEVLELIAAGHSNQAIADRLVISLSAVKKHTGNIFGKLNVNSRTQALVRARQLGLLSSIG